MSDRVKIIAVVYLVAFAILVAVGQGWVDLTGRERRELRQEIEELRSGRVLAECESSLTFCTKEAQRLRLDADRKCEPGRRP